MVETADHGHPLLVVDGYDELGDLVDAALEEVPSKDYRGRFVAIGQAVRAWALREPATYALLFGSPVPKALAADVKRIREGFPTTAPDDLILRGVLSWAALFGCVSFEVFGQYGPDTFTATDQLFERQLQVLADTTGLPTS